MNYIMPARELETVRQLSNDERRASWASRYYCAGHHRFDPGDYAEPDAEDVITDYSKIRGE